jgi:radical SAM protein with 4Fe4S-binding SPASM domain
MSTSGARYFRLAADCFLVEGSRDAVLYDLARGRILTLDAETHARLRRCERNLPCDDVDEECLGALEAAGLGWFEDEAAYVDRFRAHAPVRFIGPLREDDRFFRVNWQITARCDLACAFCPRSAEMLTWQACMTCVRAPSGPEAPDLFADVGRIVEEAAGLRASVLHLRGGDPLLEWERVEAIVAAARRHPPLRVLVTTPATADDAERAAALYEAGDVVLNVVMFGSDLCASDESARAAAARQQALVQRLAQEHRTFAVTVMLRGGSPEDREAVRDSARRLGAQSVMVAEIGGDSRGGAPRLGSDSPGGKFLMPWRTAQDLLLRVSRNSCLTGQAEIRCDGTIHPCAGIDDCRGRAAGSLTAALAAAELHDNWWARTKDDDEPCRRCALRYACVDCAAPAAASERGIGAFCPFNPDSDRRIADAAWKPDGLVLPIAAVTAPATRT